MIRVRAGGSGVRISVGTREFSFRGMVQTPLGPPGLLFGSKRNEYKSEHSPAGIEIQNKWIETSLPPIRPRRFVRGNLILLKWKRKVHNGDPCAAG